MKKTLLILVACITSLTAALPVLAQQTALNFSGSYYINIPNGGAGSALNFTTDNFTLEAWIEPSSFASGSNNYEHTILGNDNQSGNSGFVLRTGGSRKLSFSYGYGSGWQEVATTGQVLKANRWQHVAVSKQGGNITLYVDGQVAATAALSSNTNIASSSQTLKISENGSLNSRRFYGNIDEVKIWHTVRTQQEVQADGTEICGSYPAALIAYYKLNDAGFATANTIVCSNNANLNGSANGALSQASGAILFPAGSTALYVDSAATATGCGTQVGYSWATAMHDLSPAIALAYANPQIEKIYVAKGTYYPKDYPFTINSNGLGGPGSSNNDKDKTFQPRPGLELYGGYPSGGGNSNPALYPSILDGSRAGGVTNDTVYNVVYMDTSNNWTTPNDTTKLVGFTVRNGDAQLGGLNISAGFGSGIYCKRGLNLIQNCIVTNTTGINTGSSITASGNALITGCTIFNNNDGIYIIGGPVTAKNNYVHHNNSYGIEVYQGWADLIGNEAAYNGHEGISQFESYTNITGNIVHHNSLGISVYQSFACYIAGNTITDNNTTIYAYGGAGIMLYGGTQTVTGNTILRNTSATTGGGIYCFNGTDTISHNIISGNTATGQGGGIYCHTGNYVIDGNIITNNTASGAGGILLDWGGIVTNNVIAGNTASGGAGGLAISWAYTIAGNVFANNQATYSGGVSAGGGSTTTNKIVNNTFYNNRMTATQNYGGAALNVSGQTDVENNIFWKNSLTGLQNIQGADMIRDTGSGNVKNNAFQLPATSYNTGSYYYNLGANAANNFFATDPHFANPDSIAGADGIFATSDDGLQLAAGSPMIDAGNSAFVPVTLTADVRNSTRIYGSSVDMGAYELGCIPSNISAAQQLNICKGSSTVLRVNSAAAPQDIQWYADSLTSTILDTGYIFTTPVLYTSATYWVAVAGCNGGTRTPVKVNIVTAVIQHSGALLQANAGAATYQWYTCNPMQAIAGATAAGYTVPQNGSYTVVITQYGCTDTAACVTVSNAGITTQQATSGMIIKPNPTSGNAQVTPPADFSGMLYIRNTMGQVISKMPVAAGNTCTVDLSAYPAGIYFIILSGKEQYFTGKLVRE